MNVPITVQVFMNTFILSLIKTHMTAGMYVIKDIKSVERRIQLTTNRVSINILYLNKMRHDNVIINIKSLS